MKTNIKQFYRKSEHFQRYLMENEKRVSEIRKLYNSNKKYFGKNVLDIACGGGILGFVLEQNNHNYTGIDINPDMISGAKQYAKKTKSKNKFILGNSINKTIPGKYNTITYIGNGLCHLNTYDFLKVLENTRKNVNAGTYFIIDYRDVVKLLFDKKWKDKSSEKKGNKKLISVTSGCDIINGEIIKKVYDKKNKHVVNFTHAIWSPFIIKPIMELNGWKLVKRNKINTWQGWIDVYRKV